MIKKMSDKPVLKGYDWTELGIYWDLGGEHTTDKIMARRIRQHIGESIDVNNGPRSKQVAADIKKFIKLLAKGDVGYSAPVWRGLIAIKDNYTLFKFTDILLECMWN